MELKIYLANDLGFNDAGRYWLDNVLIPRIEEVVRAAGVEPVIYEPFRDNPGEGWKGLAEQNEHYLLASNLFIGVSEGQSFDTGVAVEIGISCNNDCTRRIHVLRTDSRRTNDHPDTTLNLQLQNSIEESGGGIHKSLDALLRALDYHMYSLTQG